MTAHDLIEQFTQQQLELIESLGNYIEQNGGVIKLNHSYSHLAFNEEKGIVTLKLLRKTDDGIEVTYSEYDDYETHVSKIDQFSIDELWQIIYALNNKQSN